MEINPKTTNAMLMPPVAPVERPLLGEGVAVTAAVGREVGPGAVSDG